MVTEHVASTIAIKHDTSMVTEHIASTVAINIIQVW